MGTQIVAVRKLLIDSLAELTEFTTPGPTGQTVEATFAYKVGSKRRERCWTRNAKFSHEVAGIRAAFTNRNESADFELVIFIEGVGLTQEETSTRAVALCVAAEDWVATRANWEGAIFGLKSITVSGDGALDEAFNEKGSLAELTLPVHYEARLTTT